VILNLSDLSDEPLHAQLSRQIRAKVLSGNLDGGDALPSIRGLAKEQRVSVITVQRAYDDLEREGLVQSRRGKGFWVAPIPNGRKNTMAEERFADVLEELVAHASAEGLSGPGRANERPPAGNHPRRPLERADQAMAGVPAGTAGPHPGAWHRARPGGTERRRQDDDAQLHGRADCARRGRHRGVRRPRPSEEDGVPTRRGLRFFQRWTAGRNLDFLAKQLPGWSSDRARRLSERIALPLGTPVNKLSRGNRTKLALVAALAHGPRLLLLDEPTAGLDPVVRAEVLDVLWEITEDGEHAVLYSTHVLSDINRLADELAFLRDGQLVLRTGRDELSESWRRVSFRLQDEDVELSGIVEHRRVRAEHQVITRDAPATLQQLTELGAE